MFWCTWPTSSLESPLRNDLSSPATSLYVSWRKVWSSLLWSLDNADCDVEKQVDQSKLAFIHVVELLLDGANGGDISEITEAVTGVSPKQDWWCSLKGPAANVARCSQICVYDSAVNTNMMNPRKIVKGMLSEVDKLIQEYLYFYCHKCGGLSRPFNVFCSCALRTNWIFRSNFCCKGIYGGKQPMH